jgi:hypothetical protein
VEGSESQGVGSKNSVKSIEAIEEGRELVKQE